jgi:polyhydroxyalkanoate synthesis repressor PhaR
VTDENATNTPPQSEDTTFADGETPVVVIKKYANRRLYNTLTSSYVTLENLAHMVRAGVDFVVYDARTGEDITRMILTQIIFEAEGKGDHLMPVRFLRDLIRCYGDNLQTVLPNYLEMSMDAFRKNQASLQQTFMAATTPFLQTEELMRLNTEWVRRATQMWTGTPFDPKK